MVGKHSNFARINMDAKRMINKLQKNIFKLAILFSVVAVFFVITSYNRCLPDGCSFNNYPVCNDGGCLNETVAEHLNERTVYLNIITRNTDFYLLGVIIALFFVVLGFPWRSIDELANRSLVLQKIRWFLEYNFFNFLTVLFSDGILNPKIY